MSKGKKKEYWKTEKWWDNPPKKKESYSSGVVEVHKWGAIYPDSYYLLENYFITDNGGFRKNAITEEEWSTKYIVGYGNGPTWQGFFKDDTRVWVRTSAKNPEFPELSVMYIEETKEMVAKFDNYSVIYTFALVL
jgi:hypothetical protein